MYAEVIPFVRMPYGKTAFTYKIPSDLEGILSIGQFIRISFRRKEVYGVISHFTSTPPKGLPDEKIASILGVAEETPSWNKQLLDELLEYSYLYQSSPATMAKLFSPEIPKKKSSRTTKTTTSSFRIPDIIDQDIKQEVQEESQTIVYHSISELVSLLQRQWKKKSLILCPQLDEAKELKMLLASADESVVLWDKSLAKNKQWKQWQSIKSARIVITTRSGLYCPIQGLEQVIILSSESSDHKSWEASPHYDARAIALTRAKTLNIPLYQYSLSPRIANSQKWTILPSHPAPIHSILHKSASEPLHDDIKEQMKAVHKAGNHVVLLRTTSYEAGTLRCLDCKQQWLCPENHGSLHLQKQELVCHSCEAKLSLPTRCPSCKGHRLKAFGLGIQGLTDWMQQSSPAVYSLTAKTIDSVDLSAPSFLISSPYLLKRLYRKESPHTVGMIAFLQPETLLFLPDYRANEWFFQTMQWHRAITKDYFNLPLIVQTALKQDHPVFHAALTGNTKAFRKEELTARKTLLFPPYAKVITITMKIADIGAKAHLGAISRDIQGSTKYRVSAPIARYRQKTLYGYSWQVFQTAETPKNLDKLLKSAYSKATIDINPEQVL